MPRRQVLGALAGAGAVGTLSSLLARHYGRVQVLAPIVDPPPDPDASSAPGPRPTDVGGPRRSDEMADMIGVVLHLTGDPAQQAADHRGDYLYSRFRDRGPTGGAGWLALLAGAGLRHARCDTGGSIAPGTSPSQRYALETMRLLDQTKPAWSPPHVTGIDKVFLSSTGLAKDLPVLRAGGGRIWMIEGPNESWPPIGKFLPSFVTWDGSVYMCVHSMACENALPPLLDHTRWALCRQRGRYDPMAAYAPQDVVVADGRLWVAPPTYRQSAASAPPNGWWDLTSNSMLQPFSTDQPGIYMGYNQAGELGVAWGEFIARSIVEDELVSGGYWSRAGRAGGPTRVATWSEAGMDIYAYWNAANDASVLARYTQSMPGGATNVHLYSAGPPADVAAVCAASLRHADQVLPGYRVYLGEIGQATYPTDDALAFGAAGATATPSSVVATPTGTFPVDQRGRPMPGASTGRFGHELAQAQTIVRSWAEMFRSAPPGSRLAVYELLNEPFNGYRDYTREWGYPSAGGPFMDYNRSEGNFGLLRNDLSPKPALVSVANTCRLMGDEGDQRFEPRSLGFDVVRSHNGRRSGEASLGEFDELHWVLTQASDGAFRIPIWYVNVRGTEELLAGMGMNAMISPAPSEWVTLRLVGGPAHRMEAFNTQLSATAPEVSVVDAHEIRWLHTTDLWIIRIDGTH